MSSKPLAAKNLLSRPINPLTCPNAKANPISQNPRHPIQMLKRFLIRILVEFFCLTDPLSKRAKPHYMKKTIAAQVSFQTASVASVSE